MKMYQTCLLASGLAAGLALAGPACAQPDAESATDAQRPAAAVAAQAHGQVHLPAATDVAEALDMADVVVRIVGKLDFIQYPTPENWEELSRDQQVQWRDAFKETEEYRELLRQFREAEAARIVMTTGVDEDGTFSFEGLLPNSYKLQALIQRPGAGETLSPNTSSAYKEMFFRVEEAGETVDLGEILLRHQGVMGPGDLAPEWTATAYDGTEVSLSDFRGKYVLLDFWATWCGPCIAEVPNIKAVYADYGGEHFEVIGLSLDNTLDLPRNYHAENPTPYTNLYLGRWNEERTTGDYGIRAIPSIWLIGPDGKVVARDLRGEALREAVRIAVEGAAENEAAAVAGQAHGQVQLPAPTGDAEALDMADVVVHIESVLRLHRFPTPDNWEDMTRDEQLVWTRAFRETEEYRELVRENQETRANQVKLTTDVDEDGNFSFDGLRSDTYVLHALIRRPGTGEAVRKDVAVAYHRVDFRFDAVDGPADLGGIMLERQDYLAPGDPAPEWTAVAYDGTEVSLSDFRGKYVLVDFWATWCGPCIAEVPNIKAVYADYGGDNFEVVGLSLDNTLDLPRDYHEENPTPYTNLYLGQWNEETTTDDYGIRGIPSIWLIGPDGNIVARDLRGEALREAVRTAVEGTADGAAQSAVETE